MGMYDVLHPSEDIQCPYCSNSIEPDWQTKDLDNCLMDIQMGKDYGKALNGKDISLKDYKNTSVNCISACSICSFNTNGIAHIDEEGVFSDFTATYGHFGDDHWLYNDGQWERCLPPEKNVKELEYYKRFVEERGLCAKYKLWRENI